MRLIDVDELEPDTEWDDYYDGFMSYSKEQIENAPTVELVKWISENCDNSLIKRQDAIAGADEIIKRDTSGNNAVVEAMKAWKAYIGNLPSAQPEPWRGEEQ